jgi:hypothetical protein
MANWFMTSVLQPCNGERMVHSTNGIGTQLDNQPQTKNNNKVVSLPLWKNSLKWVKDVDIWPKTIELL